jgi:diaminopimelate epimerase
MNATGKTDATSIDLNVEGGKLVALDKKDDKYINVFLKGPVCL